MKICAACFQKSFDIFHDAFGLLANIAGGKFIGTGIQRNLSRRKEKTIALYGLGVRSDGFWRFIREYDVLQGVASSAAEVCCPVERVFDCEYVARNSSEMPGCLTHWRTNGPMA